MSKIISFNNEGEYKSIFLDNGEYLEIFVEINEDNEEMPFGYISYSSLDDKYKIIVSHFDKEGELLNEEEYYISYSLNTKDFIEVLNQELNLKIKYNKEYFYRKGFPTLGDNPIFGLLITHFKSFFLGFKEEDIKIVFNSNFEFVENINNTEEGILLQIEYFNKRKDDYENYFIGEFKYAEDVYKFYFGDSIESAYKGYNYSPQIINSEFLKKEFKNIILETEKGNNIEKAMVILNEEHEKIVKKVGKNYTEYMIRYRIDRNLSKITKNNIEIFNKLFYNIEHWYNQTPIVINSRTQEISNNKKDNYLLFPTGIDLSHYTQKYRDLDLGEHNFVKKFRIKSKENINQVSSLYNKEFNNIVCQNGTNNCNIIRNLNVLYLLESLSIAIIKEKKFDKYRYSEKDEGKISKDLKKDYNSFAIKNIKEIKEIDFFDLWPDFLNSDFLEEKDIPEKIYLSNKDVDSGNYFFLAFLGFDRNKLKHEDVGHAFTLKIDFSKKEFYCYNWSQVVKITFIEKIDLVRFLFFFNYTDGWVEKTEENKLKVLEYLKKEKFI